MNTLNTVYTLNNLNIVKSQDSIMLK